MPGQITSPIRRLGVLTGGGDVPGLNPAIKAVVYRAETMGDQTKRMTWVVDP